VVTLAPLQSGISVCRLVALLHRARYSRGARRIRQLINPYAEQDDQSSVTSRGTRFVLPDMKSFRRGVAVLALSFGFGGHSDRAKFNEQTQPDKNADEEALLMSKQALSTWGMMWVILAMYIPILLFVFILFGTADVWRANCQACDLFWETLIIMIISY